MHIQGQVVDIVNRRIYSGEVTIENGKITAIIEKEHEVKIIFFLDLLMHISILKVRCWFLRNLQN